MSYNISSSKFTHPLLKPILLELTEYFKEFGITFFVIGATARDIIMEIHNEKSGRLTHDLDIAITVNDWNQYHRIEEGIVNLENFSKDPHQKQRFLYLHKFQLDIVPFGEIMNQEDKIFWPPDEQFAMSVLGFSAANSATLKVVIDEEIEIKIASLSGVFLLKIAAWNDRSHKTNKDADDIGFILNNYLEINLERAVEFYEEIYRDDSTITTGGATLLGKDISAILVQYQDSKIKIIEIISNEISKEEESKLINQILETHRGLNYEEVHKSLKNIVSQLEA
jgi:predicted nucleotidyltransferase